MALMANIELNNPYEQIKIILDIVANNPICLIII